MFCPQCHYQEFNLAAVCPDCGFSGEISLLERLSNLSFLLTESETWDRIPRLILRPLQEQYRRRRFQVEVELGLRQPPPTAVEAAALRLQLSKHLALFEVLPIWINRGWLSPADGRVLREQTNSHISQIRERLTNAPPVSSGHTLVKRLMQRWEQLNFLRETIEQLHQAGQISQPHYETAIAQLQEKIIDVEIKAGLRERPAQPQPEPEPHLAPTAPIAIPIEAKEPPPPPRQPWTWERMWDTLLSERTLKAILFLGALLLLAAAVSWITTNWNEFQPIVQGSFLAGVTAVFYGLGWYVRTKRGLHESGLTITAIASLLVPLDFIVFYLSGGFPPDSWPTVWLAASAVCLLAYVVVTYLIQAEFFGYLVGIAAASLIVATLNWLGVTWYWWQLGLTGTALACALLSQRLPADKGKWRVFSPPLGRIALLLTAAVLLPGLGWGYIRGDQVPYFYLALAASWWIGGFALTLMLKQYPLRTLVLAAVLIYPIAVWMTQDWFLRYFEIRRAWGAVGWAILATAYLTVGHRLITRSEQETSQAAGRLVQRVGWLLVGVAAVLPLRNATVTSLVHTWLAATMILVTWLQQQPRFLFLMSLFLLTGATGWQGGQGATPPELALSWSLLAILHLLAALGLEWLNQKNLLGKPLLLIGSSAVLFAGSVIIAGLAILPPLIFGDRALYIYAIGNWIGINLWLAYLVHCNTYFGLQALLAHPRLPQRPVINQALFHWLAAPVIVPWVWFLWTNGSEASVTTAVPFMLLAWGLLGTAVWMRRRHWAYSLPWEVAAHISAVTALGISLGYYSQPWFVAATLSTAAFYFAAARLLHWYKKLWLFLGALLFPIGWLFGLEWLGTFPVLLPALTLVALNYIIVAAVLEKLNLVSRPLLQPLYAMALNIAAFALIWGLLFSVEYWDHFNLLWVAAAYAILGLSFLLYAWQVNEAAWGYAGIWIGTVAGGLMIKLFSRGSGRSAALAALLALALVLCERALQYLTVTYRGRGRDYIRRAWRLYRQPLLTTGWIVSVGAIGAALVRNLIWLGGGIGRQTWSIIALSIITGLYILSAWFFKKVRFAWFASVLVIAPWLLLADLRWYADGRLAAEWYGSNMLLLALLLLGISILMGKLMINKGLVTFSQDTAPLSQWQFPPMVVAHALVPFALLWGIGSADVSSFSLGLGILFYLTAVWVNRAFRQPGETPLPIFLYPAAALVPLWAVYLLLWLVPQPSVTMVGLLVLAFAVPALLLGRFLARREPGYQWPLYLVAYSTAVAATILVSADQPFLIGVLLFNTGLAIFSAYLFRNPAWVAVATLTFPTAAWLFLEQVNIGPGYYYGWLLIGVGALYLALAWGLRRLRLRPYSQPLLAMMFILVIIGLALASPYLRGALVAYSSAALLWGITAVWLRQPALLHVVVRLAAVAYWAALFFWDVPERQWMFALWPGIGALLLIGWFLDEMWGVEPRDGKSKKLGRFPWYRLSAWPSALWARLDRWWGFSFYTSALTSVAIAALLMLFFNPNRWQPVVILGLGTAVYTWALFRFRIRGLLLLAWSWLQFTYIALVNWIFWRSFLSFAEVSLIFMPMIVATAAMGVWVQRLRQEPPPFGGGFRQFWFGWSRPFFAILSLNIAIAQLATIEANGASVMITLLNAVLIGVLATLWRVSWMTYLPLALGLVGTLQYLAWLSLEQVTIPVAFAILATVYGIVGYGFTFLQQQGMALPGMALWERPLRHSGWGVSALSLLLLMAFGGMAVLFSIPAVALGYPIFYAPVADIQMFILVVAILGLFYLTAALVSRRRWWGYGAVGLLLTAWSTWLLLIQGESELQLYALPASIYLLGMGWLEWEQGSRALASWIDRAALLLMFGAAFWQSFGQWGGFYALLMIVEGLLIVWLGGMRRLRRLLYAGVTAVVVAVAGQLVEPLLDLNTYIFLLLGACLLILGIALEQRREKVLQFAHELRTKLEDWE